MNVKDIDDLKRRYPELEKIEISFPNSLNKVLNFLQMTPQAENFFKSLIESNTTNKDENAKNEGIKNIQDLKKAYPELVNEIISNALAEGRNYYLDKTNEIRESINAENKAIDNIVIGANGTNRRRND